MRALAHEGEPMRVLGVMAIVALMGLPLAAGTIPTTKPEEVGLSADRLKRIGEAVQRHIEAQNVAAEREVKKRARAVGGIGVAWEVVAPDRVKEKCEVVSFSRGTLTVRVRDSAARFELDRWWRGGGERELCAAGKVGIKKMKVVG